MGQNLTLNFGLSVILRNTYSNGFNISRANKTCSKSILTYMRESKFFGNFWGTFWERFGNSFGILLEFFGILWKFFGNILGILLEFSGNSYDIFWDVWLGVLMWDFFEKNLGILWDFFGNSIGILWKFFGNLKLHTGTKL